MGIESQDYPIRPNDINLEALAEGHLADFTVSSRFVAAIIAVSVQRDSWRAVAGTNVMFVYKNMYNEFVPNDIWNSVYQSFYTVTYTDGNWRKPELQLTHECIVECFKKFPAADLNIVQNAMGDIS